MVALAIVLLAQALACVFLSPFGARPPSGALVALFVMYSGAGIVLAQPMLLAIGAVFGPGRWLVRFPCGLATIAILALLVNLGGTSLGVSSNLAVVGAFFVVPFLFLQPPLFALRWWRRWRIALHDKAPAAGARRMQFSLRWLLAVATGVCVVLAVARWTYVPGSWPSRAPDWWSLVEDVCLVALVIGGLSLAALPLVGAAMGTVRRGGSLGLAAIGLVAAAGFLYWLMDPADRDTPWLITCSLPAGWVWILLNLLVLRWCGFRLVRETKALASPRSGQVDCPID